MPQLTYKVAFAIGTLEDSVLNIGQVALPAGITIGGLTTPGPQYSPQYWLENDLTGALHLCTTVVPGSKIAASFEPALPGIPYTSHGRLFVPVQLDDNTVKYVPPAVGM